ncbi:MAG TPA: hypothetical protein VNI01_13070 [Elusimicrobiota bacterium]|jgi:hypothetical protein|nr:hypothetical protein [Elusimicrobiota bacterium]
MSDKKQRLSAHDERMVAVEAGVDPRTVRAYLAGKPQRSTVIARVKEALIALGHAERDGKAVPS